jgi:hypothetical protein
MFKSSDRKPAIVGAMVGLAPNLFSPTVIPYLMSGSSEAVISAIIQLLAGAGIWAVLFAVGWRIFRRWQRA